ncbi:hypothetical protein ACLKA6_003680 [Drosophila palustris]
MLEDLDLSHNPIQRLTKIISRSLTKINLSWCNITTIESTALSRFPPIDHNNFQNFPELEDLHLNGNRLTSPVNSSYFGDNQSLKKIWLADNPCICDGQYPLFFGFNELSTAKIMDNDNMRCNLTTEKT